MKSEDGKEYTVTWQVKVTASSPEAAARKALEIQRSYRTESAVFSVEIDPDDDATPPFVEVNLHEGTVRYPSDNTRAMYYTADGHPVQLGAIFWDNDLQLVRVVAIAHHIEHNWNTGADVAWHRADRLDPAHGLGHTFDGSRLALRHPFTGQLAPQAAAEFRPRCTFDGCTGVYNPLAAGTDPGEGRGVLSGWSFSLSEDDDVPVHDHTTG